MSKTTCLMSAQRPWRGGVWASARRTFGGISAVAAAEAATAAADPEPAAARHAGHIEVIGFLRHAKFLVVKTDAVSLRTIPGLDY